MRQLLILVTALLCSLPQAFAVIADHLVCNVEVNDWPTRRSVKQTFDFYVARLAEATSSHPNAKFTSAAASQHVAVTLPTGTAYVSLNIGYRHAFRTVKRDGVGIIDARELACNVLSASWCEQGESCSVGSSVCMVSSADPFDPINGWPRVGVAPDRTPLFDESQLPSMFAEIRDAGGKALGEVVANCKFKGTHQ